MAELETARLRLRQWRDSDYPLVAQMNADPEVMEYFPSTLDEQQTREAVDRYRSGIEERGWGFWAVEQRANGEFIGIVGISPVADELPCAPAVEIGWRLRKASWRQGYAGEAARACLDYAFDTLGLEEVVAITTIGNAPSRAVMRSLGMHDSGEDFVHPRVDPDSPIADHVLYRIGRDER